MDIHMPGKNEQYFIPLDFIPGMAIKQVGIGLRQAAKILGTYQNGVTYKVKHDKVVWFHVNERVFIVASEVARLLAEKDGSVKEHLIGANGNAIKAYDFFVIEKILDRLVNIKIEIVTRIVTAKEIEKAHRIDYLVSSDYLVSACVKGDNVSIWKFKKSDGIGTAKTIGLVTYNEIYNKFLGDRKVLETL